MSKQKRVAAIHDISGLGKCSLTVALPILSAAGIETCVLPTAILSTHTGGFTDFTYRDLTEDILPFAKHWKSLDIEFDAMYSGFLGSFQQLSIVSEIFDIFQRKENLILVDPVMADNGRLYQTFTPNFVEGMAKLCKKADLIVPNITEAAFLLGESYQPGPYKRSYVEKLLKNLCRLGPKQVVLTGVCFDDKKLGAATYDNNTNTISYSFSQKVDGVFHGTGDIFASVLLSAVLNGFEISKAAQLAVNFVTQSILRTHAAGTDLRFGVNFENSIPYMIQELGL